ncbi:MAG: hypothetical protein WBG43_07195 [Marinifilaceae bacterium]
MIFEKIEASSSIVDELDAFLDCNMQSILDFYNSSYSEIIEQKDIIDRFVLFKIRILENLDYSKVNNKAFLAILFDLCERFDLVSSFQAIVNIVQHFDMNFGKRLEAVELYMLTIRSNSDLIIKFDSIYELLNEALDSEEDNEDRVLVAFANYFKKVIDTSQVYIDKFKEKTLLLINLNNSSFLNCNFIKFLFSVNTSDFFDANIKIQEKIETCFSEHNFEIGKYNFIPEFLCENNTNYSNLLEITNPCFMDIRNISLNQCENIIDVDDVDISLRRGVSILDDEEQMFLYMKKFGNMHNAKLVSAFKFISDNFNSQDIDVIDWGCGQALGCISFAEYYKDININKVILIEPSEICLKRAALHVNKILPTSDVITINKTLDNIPVDYIRSNDKNVKVHLFSNILDIETFSLSKLIDKICVTQKGINFFVCVSPYITDIKTARINSFVHFFRNKYSSFELIADETNSSELLDFYWTCNNDYKGNLGVYCKHTKYGCKNKWTRVLRVFKVVL